MNQSLPVQLNSKRTAEEGNAGITRRGKTGEPMTSKTGESINDVIIADSYPNLHRRTRRTHGKKQESAFIELWDSWMKGVITE